MEFLSIRDFTTATRETQEKLDRDGKIILTNHGKPTALVFKLDSDNFEETLATVQRIEHERLIARKLTEAQAEANDPNTKWMTHEEVFGGLRQKYGL